MANETGKKKGQRSCIACGKQAGKAALFRIVRDAAGTASFDGTGRAPGRGAYVCSAACLEAACKTGRLDRALRAGLGREDYERIAGDLARSLGEAR